MVEEIENVVVCERYTLYLEHGHHRQGIGAECHKCGGFFRSMRAMWGHAESVCGYKLKKRMGNRKGLALTRRKAA